MIGEAPSPIRSNETDAHAFIIKALEAVDVTTEDATHVADVLIAADVRGIESHGIARLDHFYVARIQNGVVKARPDERITRENATQTLFDAGNGLGHPVSKRAMALTIEKAKKNGIAWATVANSNHYGIAAYYAMMALDHDVIGFSTTNSSQLVAPTFGREKIAGTNPISYAIPSGSEPPFVLDMATSTVTFGRLEVAERKSKPLLPGWAIDPAGHETLDPKIAKAGALLPLGGIGTESGGHKGYGLALLVEILCGVLSGSAFGNALKVPEDGLHGGHTAHCFGAISIEAVRDLAEFKADMDRDLRTFRTSTPGPGQQRVMVAGDPEREATERFRREGVPINDKVYDALDAMANRLGIAKLDRFTVGA